MLAFRGAAVLHDLGRYEWLAWSFLGALMRIVRSVCILPMRGNYSDDRVGPRSIEMRRREVDAQGKAVFQTA